MNEKALAGKSPIMAIDNYPMDSDSNDQPATRQADVVTEHQQSLTITRTWQGPLPDPESLAHYERVAPGAAERILAVFERQVKHRLSMEARDSKRRDWGLALAFIVVILLVATGAWLVFLGHDWAGAAVIAIDVVGLAAVFITGGIRWRQGSSHQDNLEEVMDD